MNRFLLLALTAGLLSPIAAVADLGKAEDMEIAVFDAWCGRTKNKCKVVFEGNILKVDDSKGIKKNQIKRYWKDAEVTKSTDTHYYYYITYQKLDKSSEVTGKFILANYAESKRFWNTLKIFNGSLDPR